MIDKFVYSKTRSSKEKYFLNENRYYEVTDTIAISNLNGNATGRIYAKFRTNSNKQQTIYSFRPQNQTGLSQVQLRLNFDFLTEQYSLNFVYRENSVLLRMYINPAVLPIYSLSDGEIHEVEVIVDGIENRIIIDNVDYTVANGGLIIDIGDETSTYFANSIESIAVGVNDRYNSTEMQKLHYFEGYIYEFKIFDTDLTTELYSATFDNEQISASATTVARYSTILDLPLNNSLTDLSDSPKTITENGTVAWEDGLFGELNSAAVFDNSDYLGFSLAEELSVYSISFWFISTGRDVSTDRAVILTNDNNNITAELGSIGLMHSALNDTSLKLNWDNFNGTNYAGGSIENIKINTWYHVVIELDATNNTVKAFLNSKDVTSKLADEGVYDYDLSRIQPLTISNYRIGNALANLTAALKLYNIKIKNYLMSQEEIVSEFKILPQS